MPNFVFPIGRPGVPRRTLESLAGLPFAFAALFGANPAWGNAAAPLPAPSHEGGAFIAQPTTLIVEHEDLRFRCTEGQCEFEAVYQVQNPGDAREEVVGAFYGIATDRFETTVDGVDARYPLAPAQTRAVDDAVAVFDPAVARDATIAREGFALGVGAHARVTLVFSGRMHPVAGTRGSVVGEPAIAPLTTRHPWLGTTARSDRTESYAYALSPIRHWGGSPNIDVTVRCASEHCWPSGQEGWTVNRDGGAFVARRTIAARDASILSFAIVGAPGTNVLHGGPLVGVGARLDAAEFRGRLGYEAAFPWWMIGSASVETNFKNAATFIALAEAATPDLFGFIPSLGIGAGLPVQVRSGAATLVGIRMQLTVSFPVVSIVLPVDAFPEAAERDRWQAGLFAQASF